jgi:hypothetical protein
MLLIAVSPAKETTPAHSGGQKTAKTGDEKLHLDRPVYATALYGSSSSRPLDAEVGHLLQEIKRCRQAGLPDPEMPIHPDDTSWAILEAPTATGMPAEHDFDAPVFLATLRVV